MIYSASSIATFDQCPAKFKFAYIDRVEVAEPEPHPAMTRGTEIHDSVEKFLLGHSEYLHPDIHKDYGQFMFSLRESGHDLKPEFKWGVTWEYEPCSYSDPRAMLHGFVDLLMIPDDPSKSIIQYEWKTGGKYFEKHDRQAHLYATAMMAHFPDRPGVDSYVTYFDHNDYRHIHYPAEMMREYRPMFRKIVGRISDATRFPPTPSFACKWCKFSRHNGGPCPIA